MRALPPTGRFVMAHTKLLDAWRWRNPALQETEAIDTFGGNKQARTALLPGFGPAFVTIRLHEAAPPIGTNRLDEESVSLRSAGAAVGNRAVRRSVTVLPEEKARPLVPQRIKAE